MQKQADKRDPTRRILVVPEGLLSAEAGAAILTRRTYRLRTASTSREGLTIALSWRPHVIILGSSLPGGLTARDLVGAIRGDALLRDAKLLMITDQYWIGQGSTGASDCDSHLVTPVDTEQLVHTVSALLAIEMRAAPRADVNILGVLHGVGGGDDAHAPITVNIFSLSETGCGVEAAGPLRVSANGTVFFVVAAETKKRLRLRCEVRWAVDELSMRYGIEFIGVPSSDREALKQFVTMHRTETEQHP